MFRKTMLITALCLASVSLTGCSTAWSMVGDMSYKMSHFTKLDVLLRRTPAKTDVSFTQTTPQVTQNACEDSIGECLPAPAKVKALKTAHVSPILYPKETIDFNVKQSLSDTSPYSCPDDTYLAEDNSCIALKPALPNVAAKAPKAAEPAIAVTPSASKALEKTRAPKQPPTPYSNPDIECPKGFTLISGDVCIYY